MKRFSIFITALAVMLYFGGISAFADRGRGPEGGHTRGHGARITGKPSTPDKLSKTSADKGSKMESRKDPSHMHGRKTVGDRLAHNTQLSSKLQGLLPAGTNLKDASSGFKNMGQFVAAVHVSHNLNIPFDQLKAKMTGNPSMSLGKAIHELNPNVDAKAEAKKAKKQGKRDIKDSKAETKEAEKQAKENRKESTS